MREDPAWQPTGTSEQLNMWLKVFRGNGGKVYVSSLEEAEIPLEELLGRERPLSPERLCKMFLLERYMLETAETARHKSRGRSA